ncbi:hypothetical protein IC607_01565 [Cellulomonas sp. JH27-2]|uniref:hypothetical protein n=1 Tax=Cellulomonas sp. JH27-2 TaxID=2774139 RepID=UPI00177D0D46|nr:hypothetical protein [Cellulomonas sp. JH27-2]MBD8057655.1 hypothetical protein [Cellulomonas sp. JH27-2]
MTTRDEGAARGAASDPATGGGADASSGEGASFDRSVRFWLRAYPRRWRAVRADEVVEVLTDLAGPDVRRGGARTAVGLVAAGVAARWRMRPPTRVVARCRLLGLRPPAAYDPWLRDDLDGIFYNVRELIWRSPFLAVLVAILQIWQSPPWFVGLAAAVALGLVSDELTRRRLRRHYFDTPSEELGHFQPYRGLDTEPQR